MTGLLIRLFIKDKENIKDTGVREKYGKMAGGVGMTCNLLLSAAKIIVGALFASISILADGINNLSDATSSVVTLIGFKLSGRPADREHPFGHARYEYVSGLIVAFLILMVGLNLIQSSFNKILHPAAVQFGLLAILVLAVSIALKLWMYFFYRKISRTIQSSSLLAAAADSRNDVITTSGVLVCAALAELTGLQLDGYAGLAIALFIIYSGIKLVKETLSPLIGEAPDKELVCSTVKRLNTYDGVLGIHDLVIHNYGPGRCFASVHVEVDAKNDIMQSHDLADTIERDFVKDGIQLVVHLDPIVTDNEAVNELKQMTRRAIATISDKITLHDFRVVFGYNYQNLIFDIVIPADCRKSEEELKREVQEAVHAQNSSCYTVINVDRNYNEIEIEP